jgi:hypothetical protein
MMRAEKLAPDKIARFHCSKTGLRMYPIPDPRGLDYGLLAVPGVTSVLGALSPAADKQRLENWRAREVAAGRDPEAGSKRGTLVHELLEGRVLGRSLRSDNLTIAQFAQGMDAGFEEFDSFLWSEKPLIRGWEHCWNTSDESHPDRLARVWSTEWGISGTPDLIGVRNGKNVLSDFKTSSKLYFQPKHGEPVPYNQKFPYMKYKKCVAQLCMYSLAIEETLGLSIDELEIRVGTPEQSQILQVSEMEYRRELENAKKSCVQFWERYFEFHTAGQESMLVAA